MKYVIKKELNNWLKENGFEDIKVYNNNDFEAQSANGLIGVANHIDENGFTSFEELVNELELEYDITFMALYFLHELGHTQTYDIYDSVDELKYMLNNFYITQMIKLFGNLVYNKMNYKYQRLPQEYSATEWAVWFANNNYNAIQKLEKILEQI